MVWRSYDPDGMIQVRTAKTTMSRKMIVYTCGSRSPLRHRSPLRWADPSRFPSVAEPSCAILASFSRFSRAQVDMPSSTSPTPCAVLIVSIICIHHMTFVTKPDVGVPQKSLRGVKGSKSPPNGSGGTPNDTCHVPHVTQGARCRTGGRCGDPMRVWGTRMMAERGYPDDGRTPRWRGRPGWQERYCEPQMGRFHTSCCAVHF